jgi:hypothetical protein
MSTVTMQELELETAELLPSRETLWCQKPSRCEPEFELEVNIEVEVSF